MRYRRPHGISEEYVAGEKGVEQIFVLNEPLELDGDLEIVGRLDSELVAVPLSSAEGIVFLAQDGRVALRYGRALVYDIAGRQVTAELRLEGKTLSIVLPQAWLAEAAYPVTVDPPIEGGNFPISTDAGTQSSPDVCQFSATASGDAVAVTAQGPGVGYGVSAVSLVQSGGTWQASRVLGEAPDGPQMMSFRARDAASNVGTGQDDYVVDNTPLVGGVTIAAGAAYTNGLSVTLTLTASDAYTVTLMRMANGAPGGSWQPYQASLPWQLSAGDDGLRQVFVRYRD